MQFEIRIWGYGIDVKTRTIDAERQKDIEVFSEETLKSAIKSTYILVSVSYFYFGIIRRI